MIAAVAGLLLVTSSCTKPRRTVAEDRAQIMDLQARYLALDFFDMDAYVSTFTCRTAYWISSNTRQRAATKSARDSRSPDLFSIRRRRARKGHTARQARHNITNIVLRIDGTERQETYWFHYGNNNPERRAVLDAYGHYEDEMVKVDGQWLFSKRTIYNEAVEKWIAPPANPAW